MKDEAGKPERAARRQRERAVAGSKEEQNRQKSVGGGQTNELGVTQGQNGEQGNTTEPRNTVPVGNP
jgi:hypothetical protein